MKHFVKWIACLLLCCMLLALCACGGGEENPNETDGPVEPTDILPGFDYSSVDLSQYISLGDWNYHDMTISIKEVAEVTDEAVKTEFNSYFNQKGNEFYQSIADDTKPVANGDILYLLYSGVKMSVLEKAVADGKISDVECTGMTYSEILALNLGFEGGTSQSVSSLTIGSNTFIAGFESGLVGYVPSAAGEENPVRLRLSFPEKYSSAELAGQSVIFFCKLVYIGDKAAGVYTADNITVERVNELLNLSDEVKYSSMEQCLDRVREGLESTRESKLYSAKTDAIFAELSKRATVSSVPDDMLTAYVESAISTYLAELVNMYNHYPDYYKAYFGTEKPSRKLVIAYLQYSEDNYMQEMKKDATDAVKTEMIFWHLIQQDGITLTDDEIAERREEYIDLYGESVFDGISDRMIREQFLRDKFLSQLIDEMKEKGNITYTTA